MWNENIIKIIPAVLFLFCLLEIFEMGLIASGLNKTEKLEARLQQNLEALEIIADSLNEHSKCMGLEHLKKK
ncbi:hypothetical protein [Helicobacter pylori]|uniref:hypothetical protein n=1 Tax=Helicobacter pylori TaxID=210 RepID=UPI000681F34C|nr:hypothetical protein [Helicobacter pylori]KNE09788.1 hypothetical protein ACM27_04300 [Helicobacter pylori]